jgi:hypothetical protein
MGNDMGSTAIAHGRRCTAVVAVGCALLGLVGCQGPARVIAPQVDQVRFTPLPVEQRIIDEPTVKFLPREDGHEYCARITGIPITPTSLPMACAFWNVLRKECSIITPLSTGYNYLGHELRHCFEGAFHD